MHSEASVDFANAMLFMQPTMALPGLQAANSRSTPATTGDNSSSLFASPQAGDEEAAAKKFFVCEFHDELASHGRIQTYAFRAFAHQTRKFNRTLKGKVISAATSTAGNAKPAAPATTIASRPATVATASSRLAAKKLAEPDSGVATCAPWLAATRNMLLAFIKKIGESTTSARPRKVVDRATGITCEKVCKEIEERNLEDGTSRDLYFFFCGTVVFEIECAIVVGSYPIWKFEADELKTWKIIAKVDAARLERKYQEKGGQGITDILKVMHSGFPYYYDFDQMIQVNNNSKKCRKLQRIASPASSNSVIPHDNGTMLPWKEIRSTCGSSSGNNSAASTTTTNSNGSTKEKKSSGAIPTADVSKTTKSNTNNNNDDDDASNENEEEEGESVEKILREEEEEQQKLYLQKLKQEEVAGAERKKALEAQEQERQQVLIEQKKQEKLQQRAALKSGIRPGTAGMSNSNNNNENNNQQQQQLPPSTPLSPAFSPPSIAEWLLNLRKPENGSISLDILQILHNEKIDEQTFPLLTLEALQSLGIPLGPRLQLMNTVKKMSQQGTTNSNTSITNNQLPELKPSNSTFLTGNLNSTLDNNNNNNNNNAVADDDSSFTELMQTISQNFPKFLIIDPVDVEIIFESPLGSGGSGQVYEAKIGGFRPAAAKLFSDISDGLAEAKICQKMHHKNIIGLIGVTCFVTRRSANVNFRVAPRIVLLLELADNSLHSILTQRASSLEWPIVERFALQIAEGLSYIHSEGVIHLDIKPQNILMTNTILKICDFGISRKKRNLEQTHTVVTRVALSLVWSAPEQRKNREVSPRNDCFSFGAILFWMIAMPPANVLADCNRLIDADQIPEKLLQAMDDGAVRNGCPKVLESLCRQCLNLDPKKRPADGAELLRILDGECEMNELVRGVNASKTTTFGSSSSEGSTSKVTEVVHGGYETSYVAEYKK